jgi:hypothetical protein
VDSFITSYTALSTQAVAGVQKLGVLTVPLVVVVAAIVNYFGGERAIRAVGVALAVVAILTLILNNAVAFSNWVSGLPHG